METAEGFDYHIVFHSLPFLIKGMGLTLLLTFLAMVGGIFLGTLLALARLSPYRTVSFAAGADLLGDPRSGIKTHCQYRCPKLR